MKASREAELAINVAIDTGFADAVVAARAVRNAKADDGIDYTVQDWLVLVRRSAGTFWDGIENTTRHWMPAPRVRVYVRSGILAGTPPAVEIETVVPTKELACKAACAMLKAEERCSKAEIAKGAAWLMKRTDDYWTGSARISAFRRCSPTSAFDWYVLLVVEMRQELGIKVDGFAEDPQVVKNVRARRRSK